MTRNIGTLIAAGQARRRKVGLCGRRPRDDPEFARSLVEAGLDSISVASDSVLVARGDVAAAERDERCGGSERGGEQAAIDTEEGRQ